MKKNTMIGIDIGNCELKFAVCKNGTADFYAVQLPEDMVSDGRIRMLNSMKDFIKETRKELRLPKAECALVLPDQLVFCRRINMPYVREQQLILNLPYEFHDYIPQETEKYYFDYAVDEIVYDDDGNPASLNIMAAAVQKQLVDEYMELFSSSGFKLRKILPREMAYIAILRRYQQEEFPEAYAAKLQQSGVLSSSEQSKNKKRFKPGGKKNDDNEQEPAAAVSDDAAGAVPAGSNAAGGQNVSQSAQSDSSAKSGGFGSRLKAKLSGKSKNAGTTDAGIIVDDAAAASVVDASFSDGAFKDGSLKDEKFKGASFKEASNSDASFRKTSASGTEPGAVLQEAKPGAGGAAHYSSPAAEAYQEAVAAAAAADIDTAFNTDADAGSADMNNDNSENNLNYLDRINSINNSEQPLVDINGIPLSAGDDFIKADSDDFKLDLIIDLQAEESDPGQDSGEVSGQKSAAGQSQLAGQTQTTQAAAQMAAQSFNPEQLQAQASTGAASPDAAVAQADTADVLNHEYCFVDIGHQSTRLHFFCGTTLVNSRSIDYGCHEIDLAIANEMHVDEYVASSYKPANYLNILDSAVCREAYTQLSVEIMKAINFYRFNNRDNNLSDIYFLGGGAMIPALREAVAEAAGLTMHLFSELFWSENDEKALQAAVAYGTVLD